MVERENQIEVETLLGKSPPALVRLIPYLTNDALLALYGKGVDGEFGSAFNFLQLRIVHQLVLNTSEITPTSVVSSETV